MGLFLYQVKIWDMDFLVHYSYSFYHNHIIFSICLIWWKLKNSSKRKQFLHEIVLVSEKTSTNRAGVAKLYAKPRFSKQIKISFDVLTFSIWFFGKSWNLFQNLIEHNIYKVFDYVWSYRVILSHTDSYKESHFVIHSHM